MIEVFNLSALVLRKCMKRLLQAFLLILFFGSTFILLGKQLYKGVLSQKCVILPPLNISDATFSAFVSNSSNWLENRNEYYLCGNSTGSRPCPQNYTCLRGADINTYISNFNFYGSSVVTISQLMTLHFWQELYQKMLLTAGTLHVTYFVLAFYSFLYSSGLILAIITRSYNSVLEEYEVIDKKARLNKKDNTINGEQPKGIVKSPSCKSYELFSSQIINSERIERQATEIIESSSQITDKSMDSDSGLKEHLSEIKQKREAVRCKLAIDKVNDSVDQISRTNGCWSAIRHHLKQFLSHIAVEIFFVMSIVFHLTVCIVQYSQIEIIPARLSLLCYYTFCGISFIEVALKMAAYSPQEYFKSKWNAFDALVLVIGGTELLLLDVEHPVLLTLRAYRLIKLIGFFHTFEYLKTVLENSLFMFGHPASILIVFIIICIVTGMQLYGYQYFHSEDRFPDQDPPRWFFKDFYSSFVLVFCMICGDWKQPMVNTVLFTSYTSDLVMLIFVLIGNFVIINLFLGIVFYMFYYKTYTKLLSKDTLQNAIHVILNRQRNVSDNMVNRNSKKDNIQQSESSGSDPSSDSHNKPKEPPKKTKKRNLHNPCEMEIMDDSSEYMDDCCPSLCYFCCSFCKADENPNLWQKWADIRCKLYCLVETKIFRGLVSLVIIFSAVVLILEQSHGPRYPDMAFVLRILNPVFFFFFLWEMSLKWMAYGLHKFFKSNLGRFEFCILLIYLIDLLTIKFFEGQKSIFKALKAFRLLSLLSLFKSYQETVPLPMKRTNVSMGSETASNESLLHMRQLECNRFLGRHCRSRPSGSGEMLQMEWNAPEIQSCDLSESRIRRIEVKCSQGYRDKNHTVHAHDCLPTFCHGFSPICQIECRFFKVCNAIRTKILLLVTSIYFLCTIEAIIFSSCLFLAVELNYSSTKAPIIERVSKYADIVIAFLFAIEMILKMFAHGFKRYFTNFWFILEFFTALVTAMVVVLCQLGINQYSGFKMIRVFRLLFLYKLLKFNKQSKTVLKSLKHALPSYVLVAMFVFYLWSVFAVFGAAMFNSKLLHCIDSSNNILLVPLSDCRIHNGTLKNSPVNFDTFANSFIALLQVATLQNWISFVTDIMDNSNKGNVIKNEVYTATFFPMFIMFSTFLTLNLFVGVTCWHFNSYEQDKRPAFAKWIDRPNWLYNSAIRKMAGVKLQKVVPAPKLPFQAFLYRMVMSDNFEMAGFVFIGLHMLLIALDMYEPHPSEMFALAMRELNLFFIVIFSVECIIKLLAYRQYYFKSLWNHFDVMVVALCICGALFEELFSSPMLPAMLRLVRFLKCRRYLRRYIRGMLPLLYTLYFSIPAFITLVILQFIVMFIYACFGVFLFHDVKQSWDISGELSFETFPKAMLLLFQLSTLAGWIDVLHCLSESGQHLTCATVFVVSYIIVVYYIIIKTHLIVIIDSYDTAVLEYENSLLKEDYEMFAEVWQKFDNNARGVIKYSYLPDLFEVLEEPFHFDKPNRFLIATFNIPIYEGELVFYADVMDALTRDFMSHNAHLIDLPDSIPGISDKAGKTLNKISSSLWRQRQNHCAYIIQRAWRCYSGRLVRSPVFYSEVRLAEQGDKVDTFLAAGARSSSHVSV